MNPYCAPSRTARLNELPGNFAWQMNLPSKVRGNTDGQYVRTIGGPAGIGDPVLMQRSWRSSGSERMDVAAPAAPIAAGQTYTSPVLRRPGPSVHPGIAVGMPTRMPCGSQAQAVPLQEVDMTGYSMGVRKSWPVGYVGMASVGQNVPSRTNAACRVQQRFAATAHSPTSMRSYGSYGR